MSSSTKQKLRNDAVKSLISKAKERVLSHLEYGIGQNNDKDGPRFKLMLDLESKYGYNKILNYIHKVGSVTKEQIMDYLGWGRGIPFDIYRNRLREEPTIKLTKSGYEVR